MTPAGMRAVIHLTITDDFPQAQAVVVISAVADDRSGPAGGVDFAVGEADTGTR